MIHSTDETPALAAAIDLIRLGWAVLPIWAADGDLCDCGNVSCGRNAGKHPVGPLAPRGVKDATRDESVARGWFAQLARANIGVATGEPSGFDVLDIDGEVGAESVRMWEAEHGALPETVEALTGGGGRHLLFTHRPGLRNGVAILPGVDVRTTGGYVVVPPSTHRSGRAYQWEAAHVPGEHVIACWPDALAALALRHVPSHRPTAPVAPPAHGFTRYGQKAADDEIASLRAATPGTRNACLNRVAFSLGQLAAGGEVPDMADTLESVGLEIGLDPAEVTKTVRSGWSAGMAQPRQAPPRTQAASHAAAGAAVESSATAPAPAPGPAQAPQRAASELHTDLGNARRLVRHHGQDLRHTAIHGWLVWDGTRWERDETREADRRAKAAMESLWSEARDARDPDAAKALAKHAIRSQSAHAIEAALRLASTEPAVAARWRDFDAHPWLLNLRNGVLDLRTGALQPHDQALCITRRAEAAWDPDATCPRWCEFLEQVLPDIDVRAFVQRLAGYTLTGIRTEQVFAFLYGTGSNGKSTFLDVLASVMGDYGLTTPFDTFLERQAGQATNDLARLAGARFVRASEPDEGAVLSESVVKQATGGEPITARYLRQEFFTFQPEFALWLSGNHQPRVRGTDHGLWRRVRLIPFTVRVEKGDPHLKEKLLAERDGILRWLVEGCEQWQEHGMEPPKAVLAATAGYRQEQDVAGQFLEEVCELVPSAVLTAKSLRRAYETWCEETGERPISPRAFAGRLHERGIEHVRGRAGWTWVGLRLRSAPATGTSDPWEA